jgi:hypothetical protein
LFGAGKNTVKFVGGQRNLSGHKKARKPFSGCGLYELLSI